MENTGAASTRCSRTGQVPGQTAGGSRQPVHPEAEGGPPARRGEVARTGHAIRSQPSAIPESILREPESARETRRRNEENRGGNREFDAPEQPARGGNQESDGGAACTGARPEGESQ